MAELIYVFGVTRAGEATDGIIHEGLHAITEVVSEDDFGEESLQKHLTDMAWVTDKVVWHQKQVDAWAARVDVIPFKFGSLFKTADNVRQMIEDKQARFHRILDKIAGHKEWGVKLFYHKDQLGEWLQKSDEHLIEMGEELVSSTPGKAFLLKKQFSREINAAVKAKVNAVRAEVYEMTQQYAADVQLSDEQPPELSEDQRINALNMALLVEEDQSKACVNAIETIHQSLDGTGMTIECTGPWPAYNFAAI